MPPIYERRLLQIAVLIACLVPVSAGLAGVLLGPGLLAGTQGSVSLDSHFRYLSGLLLGIGLTYLSLIPRIETHTRLFRALAAIIVIGGLARLYSLWLEGMPNMPNFLAIFMELGVVPALACWQGRVARRNLFPVKT